MRTFNTSILAEYRKGGFRPFRLLELALGGETYRFTDCDVPLVWDGDAYHPRDISIEAQYSAGTAGDVAGIRIDNLDDYLTAAFVGGDPKGSDVVARSCVVTDAGVVAAVILFQGALDAWEMPEGELTLDVVGPFVRWAQRTMSVQPGSCRWDVFKGDECGYAGAGGSCDRTYAQCDAYNNTENFGGYRFLPSIQYKQFWWGRNRWV